MPVLLLQTQAAFQAIMVACLCSLGTLHPCNHIHLLAQGHLALQEVLWQLLCCTTCVGKPCGCMSIITNSPGLTHRAKVMVGVPPLQNPKLQNQSKLHDDTGIITVQPWTGRRFGIQSKHLT